MSFGASAVAWHHSKATGTDLLVLMAIANYINDDGAWPKVETIAKDARTSVRQAHRSINALKALGEIDWIQKAGKGRGVYKSNLYVFLLKCPPECQGDWNHTCQDVTARPDNLSPLDMTPPADKPITKPVKEHISTQDRKSQIKEDWQPSDELVALFATKWPLINHNEQLTAFRLYHMAKGSKFVKWDLAYQNWLNKAQGWASEKQMQSKGYDPSKVKGWFE